MSAITHVAAGRGYATASPTHTTRSPGRWSRIRTGVRRWFAASQLGPVDNYVTR